MINSVFAKCVPQFTTEKASIASMCDHGNGKVAYIQTAKVYGMHAIMCGTVAVNLMMD